MVRLRVTGDNAQRYGALGTAGAVLACAALVAAHGSQQQVGDVYVAAVAIGMLLCIVPFAALAVATYRRAKAFGVMRDDRGSSAEAAKRHQRRTAYGSFIIFAGIAIGAAHTVFGVPAFPGEWALELVCLFGGIVVQLYSQVAYLRALG